MNCNRLHSRLLTGMGFMLALSSLSLGQQAGTLDAISSLMACVSVSNTANAYSCTTFPTFKPVARDMLLFRSDATNTGPSTISVNGLNPMSVVLGTSALTG